MRAARITGCHRAASRATRSALCAALLIGQIARRRNADEWLRRNVPLPAGIARP